MGKPGRTRRGAAKRFKMTKSGHIKRKRAYHSHILTKKAQDRKRRLRKKLFITSAGDLRAVKRMLLGVRATIVK